jgi:hypothetical protein
MTRLRFYGFYRVEKYNKNNALMRICSTHIEQYNTEARLSISRSRFIGEHRD